MKKHHSKLRNLLISIGIMGCVTVGCVAFPGNPTQISVILVYVLAVLFVARYTNGYLYGILSSMFAVLCVNYIFTYPYMAFNFSLEGYPLTFVTFLAVSCIVSALTTRLQEQEKIRLEIEREKMRANILRGVSHDIRTPLTSIIGSASAILENHKDLEEEQKLDLLQDIKDDAQWLIRMVENLLSVTRIDSDVPLKLEEEAVEEIIGGAVEKFTKNCPNVPVEVVLPPEVLLVPMQGIMIEQVFMNLLENAVNHGGATAITIRLTTEKNRCLFAVEDNGTGIDPRVLPRLFKGPLSPEEGKESDSKRNMGIGLSVCMSIISAHKGGMKAENMKGGGARISFWLPVEEGDIYGD